MRLFFSALLLALQSVASAQAVTMTLSGDRGFGQVDVQDADLYVADPSFRVFVEQNRPGAAIGVIIRGSPPNSAWTGGTVIGTGINRTASWQDIYVNIRGPGNGACFIIKNTVGMTVERLHCEWTWDGFRPEGINNQNWVLRQSWFSNLRDDGVENDQCNDGRIEQVLIEDVFVGYSSRPGTADKPCLHKLEVVSSLISLGRHYGDLRNERKPWSNVENGRIMQSGALWKVRFHGEGAIVLLKDNIIKLDHTPGVGIGELPLTPTSWQFLPGSGGNTFVWLGQNDLPGLTYETIDGCRVPQEFKIRRDMFKVVCGDAGRRLWTKARTDLLATIDPPPSPPPPDPVIEFLLELRGKTIDLQERIEQLLKHQQEPDG